MISLTEPAQHELARIMGEDGKDSRGIRLGVKGGGCSGYSYVMQFESGKREDDHVINEERIPIYIDKKSFELLDGLGIDYENDLLNKGFKFSNPNATQSCGCGTSFSV